TAAAAATVAAVALRVAFAPGDESAEDRRAEPLLVAELELQAKYKFEVVEMPVQSATPGMKVHTKYYYPTIAAPKGVILYLHGLNSHSGRITKFYSRSLEDGWIVGMMDFRGFGRSCGRHGYIESIDILAADAVAFIVATKTKFPDRKLFVLGTSMGGLTLLHASLKLPPGIVDSLIFHAPPVEISTNILPSATEEAIGRLLLSFVPKLPLLKPHSAHSNSESQAALVHASKAVDPNFYAGRLRIGTAYAMLNASLSIGQKLHEITTPHLLIHGTADRVCSIAGSERFFAASGADDKKFVKIPDGQHNLLQEEERYWKAYLDAISDWIESRI
ncbi:lipase, partial [Achlya hypogyna]